MTTLERFYHQITGPETAPKLVFLHGLMGFSANWRRIAKAFEDRYQILCYDQRGHGRSFKPTAGYAVDDYAQDLNAILQELGWSEVRLIGHSMGGRVAYHFANRFPKQITQLVIEDIGPTMLPTAANFVLRLIDAVPVPFLTKRDAKFWFDEDFMRIFADEPRRVELAAYLYANVIENSEKQAVWRFSENGIRETILLSQNQAHWQEIQNLACPTLLVRGETSKDLPRALFNEILQRNKNIQGVEIRDSGHWIHSDQPDKFIAVLERFFSGESQPSVSG